MSTTVCMHSLVAAFQKAEDILGKERTWHGDTPLQQRFIRDWLTRQVALDGLSIDSIASFQAQELNSFLRSHGFALTVGELSEGEFGAAAILDLLVKWLVRGTKTHIQHQGKQYEAVDLAKGVTFYRTLMGDHPVVEIYTRNELVLYMMVFNNVEWSSSKLLATIAGINATLERCYDYDGVIFPMVSLEHEPDISFVEGLSTVTDTGQPARIKKALQQNKLKLNEVGARAQSASVLVGEILGLREQVPKPRLVIDQPFILWFERENGNTEAVFAAYVTPEDWKNPGEL